MLKRHSLHSKYQTLDSKPYLLPHVVARRVQELYEDGHSSSLNDNLGVVGGA
jgi:hypothetical protein